MYALKKLIYWLTLEMKHKNMFNFWTFAMSCLWYIQHCSNAQITCLYIANVNLKMLIDQ